MRAQLETLKRAGAARLLLDLRGAAWGSPADGAKVAELFLQGGPVAKLVGRRTDEKLLQADAVAQRVARTARGARRRTARRAPARSWPRRSSTPGRAKLVGEHTFGRAAVTKTITLPEGGLVLTVAKYMSPKGNSIHGQGLAPTVPVSHGDDEDEDPRRRGEARPHPGEGRSRC